MHQDIPKSTGADTLTIAGRSFSSRLLVGTGKFASNDLMAEALKKSQSEIVTVALRRVDMDNPQDDLRMVLQSGDFLLLPNTSGARDAEEAIRLARIARSSGMEPWVKLEVTPDPRTLLPDTIETLKAAEQLVQDGFTVLPYMQADPILARRLEEVGCATVMPLGSYIGSNLGIRTKDAILTIIENASVPVVVDAGLGLPSHAAEALEIGADAVLVNTAIATAADPVAMAEAFCLGVQAGRMAYLSGAATAKPQAEASSPLTGFLRS